MTAEYVFLPWVREGAATAFTDRDPLTPVLTRPGGGPLAGLPVELTINERTRVTVPLRAYGPGDVTGIDPRVVIRVHPPPRSADLEPNLLAFVEFDRPDFPWFCTPAAAGTNGRLRPWLVLVVVRSDGATLTPAARERLPVLSVAGSELPVLTESWAWAHAQVTRPDATRPVGPILTGRPEQNLSRLVCPRRLQPGTPYLACLVPAFEAGRKAGLGLEVTQADEDRLAPAWDTTQAQVQLPVYHHWEFRTGVGGDFEALARRLVGRVLPPEIGRRPLRVRDQPFGLPDVEPLRYEGPLLGPGGDAAPGPGPAFRDGLRALLNLNAAAPTPVVTPPVYGSWQSAQPFVPEDAAPPRWLRELNLDPAARTAAGLGARIVRDLQEQLVAAAWDQLADAPQAARLERRLDVTVALLDSVVRRRVARMGAGRMVQFLGPVQSRLKLTAEPETLRAHLARRALPPSFSAPPLRRVQRPAGTLARRRSPAPVSPQRLATRVGTAVPPVDPPPGTGGLVTRRHVEDQRRRVPQVAGVAPPWAERYEAALDPVQDYFVRFTGQQPPAHSPPFVFTPQLHATLVTSIEPARVAPARLRGRLGTVPSAVPAGLVQPSFPQPMYETLRELAPELFLPGVGTIEQDTVALLNSNPRFIEAFLVGLNHELAGELLWREFPSDVRHTYARRFWDTAGLPATIGQLPPIREWAPAAALGGSFASGERHVVLLIRGELLQRYPDTLIFAVRARTLGTPGTEERMPIFRGRIPPDVTFLGFDLTEDEVRGPGTDPGWFFVLQEQPGAPEFGLDERRTKALESWNDLAWSDMRTEPGGQLRTGDLRVRADQRPAGPVWAFNAAHLAAILRQRPVRLAFHARRMLPPPAVPR